MNRVVIAAIGFIIGFFLVFSSLQHAPAMPLPGHNPPFFLGVARSQSNASFAIGNTTNTTSWNGASSKAAPAINISAGSIVVVTTRIAQLTTNLTISSVTGAGITFAQVPGAHFARTDTTVDSAHSESEIWWAFSAGALTSEVITVTASGTVTDGSIGIFEAKGVINTTAPWDTNVSLAATNGGTSAAASVSGVSTTSTIPVMILSNTASGAQGTFVSSAPPWTLIQAFNGGGVTVSVQQHNYFMKSSSAQSVATYTATGTSNDWAVIAHAFAMQ
jgi:hypothetical protein